MRIHRKRRRRRGDLQRLTSLICEREVDFLNLEIESRKLEVRIAALGAGTRLGEGLLNAGELDDQLLELKAARGVCARSDSGCCPGSRCSSNCRVCTSRGLSGSAGWRRRRWLCADVRQCFQLIEQAREGCRVEILNQFGDLIDLSKL